MPFCIFLNSSQSSKYHPGPDPLEQEPSLKMIQPTSAQQTAETLVLLDKMMEKTSDPAEKSALKMWKSMFKADQIGGVVAQEFTRDFWGWLLGRGKEADHKKSPWYRASLCHDKEVSAYVDSFLSKMHEFQLKLAVLKFRQPVGINQHYLYFKYIVRGESITQTSFLSDWALFVDEFWEARLKHGNDWHDTVERHHPHEVAPYGDARVTTANDREETEDEAGPQIGVEVVASNTNEEDDEPQPAVLEPEDTAASVELNPPNQANKISSATNKPNKYAASQSLAASQRLLELESELEKMQEKEKATVAQLQLDTANVENKNALLEKENESQKQQIRLMEQAKNSLSEIQRQLQLELVNQKQDLMEAHQLALNGQHLEYQQQLDKKIVSLQEQMRNVNKKQLDNLQSDLAAAQKDLLQAKNQLGVKERELAVEYEKQQQQLKLMEKVANHAQQLEGEKVQLEKAFELAQKELEKENRQKIRALQAEKLRILEDFEQERMQKENVAAEQQRNLNENRRQIAAEKAQLNADQQLLNDQRNRNEAELNREQLRLRELQNEAEVERERQVQARVNLEAEHARVRVENINRLAELERQQREQFEQLHGQQVDEAARVRVANEIEQLREQNDRVLNQQEQQMRQEARDAALMNNRIQLEQIQLQHQEQLRVLNERHQQQLAAVQQLQHAQPEVEHVLNDANLRQREQVAAHNQGAAELVFEENGFGMAFFDQPPIVMQGRFVFDQNQEQQQEVERELEVAREQVVAAAQNVNIALEVGQQLEVQVDFANNIDPQLAEPLEQELQVNNRRILKAQRVVQREKENAKSWGERILELGQQGLKIAKEIGKRGREALQAENNLNDLDFEQNLEQEEEYEKAYAKADVQLNNAVQIVQQKAIQHGAVAVQLNMAREAAQALQVQLEEVSAKQQQLNAPIVEQEAEQEGEGLMLEQMQEDENVADDVAEGEAVLDAEHEAIQQHMSDLQKQFNEAQSSIARLAAEEAQRLIELERLREAEDSARIAAGNASDSVHRAKQRKNSNKNAKIAITEAQAFLARQNFEINSERPGRFKGKYQQVGGEKGSTKSALFQQSKAAQTGGGSRSGTIRNPKIPSSFRAKDNNPPVADPILTRAEKKRNAELGYDEPEIAQPVAAEAVAVGPEKDKGEAEVDGPEVVEQAQEELHELAAELGEVDFTGPETESQLDAILQKALILAESLDIEVFDRDDEIFEDSEAGLFERVKYVISKISEKTGIELPELPKLEKEMELELEKGGKVSETHSEEQSEAKKAKVEETWDEDMDMTDIFNDRKKGGQRGSAMTGRFG